tara:strand:- start:161 stop:505 length:345 start_codon:yes stop_codon:yes gene_type:complete
MQKNIFEENYFGTLMCILIDESRRIMPKFNPTEQLHRIQADMCEAGDWLPNVPLGTIIWTVPQDFVRKLEQESLPEYRRLAASLIDNFIDEFVAQGGDKKTITDKFESMFIWKQ